MNFLFIAFSLVFEHVSFNSWIQCAIHDVTSQQLVIFTRKISMDKTRYFTAENVIKRDISTFVIDLLILYEVKSTDETEKKD